jgi:hypothetical protein
MESAIQLKTVLGGGMGQDVFLHDREMMKIQDKPKGL